jgi:purine nucleoside permease
LGCLVEWCGDAGEHVGTEVYHLNEALRDWAFGLSARTPLVDSSTVQAYRALYPAREVARRAPFVTRCDIVSGNTYWQGRRMSAFADAWVREWTQGRGSYCSTSMEDVGFAEAMTQLSRNHRARFDRFLVLRVESDFDQQHESQTAISSLIEGRRIGGVSLAIENAYLVASSVVDAELSRSN